MVEAKILRIVVVDDQKAMRTLIRHTLLALGCYTIIECSDGVEALAQLIEHPADLVISDLNMPRLDGLSLLRMVRKQPGIETTPFIMLTNRGELATVKEARALGVNNYIVKPFNVTTMKRKIEAVVGPLE